ncbi:hypothetical protein MYX06_05110, partial [Patescibacteria group bacterium AH-259-L05]|nr:hypothetical protein [Patescibacteria group bacterium AH-259-L05]
LEPAQLVSHYLLKKDFDFFSFGDFDALFIGAAGDYSVEEVQKKFPRVYKQLEQVANRCRSKGLPVLNICLQFWAVLLGGEVKSDPSRKEVGTITVKLTEEGKKDPLFYDIPREFKAQAGHKDYTSKLPEDAVLLAYSDLCPVHAYRTGEKEYVMQFHPDLDKKRLIERIVFYAEKGYAPEDPKEFDRLINSLEETPLAVTLIEKFVDRIVMK